MENLLNVAQLCPASVSPTTCSGITEEFCLFVLRLNVPVNNFSVMSGRSHRFLGN